MAHQTYSLYTNGSEIIGLHMANMPNRMLLQWCNTCNTVKIVILRQSTSVVATLGLDHLEKLELFQVHLESLSINFRDDWLSYGCVWVSTSSSVTRRDICHTSPNSDRRIKTRFCWLIRFLLSDFEFSTLAMLWQSVTFCQKVVPKPVQHQHDSPSTDFGEVKLCDYELDVLETILNIGKKVENWVRTNEILRICQKVVPW